MAGDCCRNLMQDDKQTDGTDAGDEDKSTTPDQAAEKQTPTGKGKGR